MVDITSTHVPTIAFKQIWHYSVLPTKITGRYNYVYACHLFETEIFFIFNLVIGVKLLTSKKLLEK